MYVKHMEYKFYSTYECTYEIKDSRIYKLYYGYFSGDKPCWNILIEGSENEISPLIPININLSDIDMIYRVSKLGYSQLRFTGNKIRKYAKRMPKEYIFTKEEFIPLN